MIRTICDTQWIDTIEEYILTRDDLIAIAFLIKNNQKALFHKWVAPKISWAILDSISYKLELTSDECHYHYNAKEVTHHISMETTRYNWWTIDYEKEEKILKNIFWY